MITIRRAEKLKNDGSPYRPLLQHALILTLFIRSPFLPKLPSAMSSSPVRLLPFIFSASPDLS
jgi:hypothetical protein